MSSSLLNKFRGEGTISLRGTPVSGLEKTVGDIGVKDRVRTVEIRDEV